MINNKKLILPVPEETLKFSPNDVEVYPPTVVKPIIIDNRRHSPPFNWSGDLFQRWIPISGDFEIGNNFDGNNFCGNNPTGRAFYANPCGYWENVNDQFFGGEVFKNTSMQPWNSGNINLNGNLYPVKNGNTSPPQNRIVFGYARIGEEYRGR